jgi:hypothetical protein
VTRLRRGLRSRLTLDRLAIAIVLVSVFLGVRSLAGGSGSETQVDHAAGLVPRHALLYVHLRVDRSSKQWRNGDEIVRKLPALGRLRDQALREVAGGRDPAQLEVGVRSWLGHEAALALLPDGATATSLVLLQVADRAGAEAFLASAGSARQEVYRGTPVRRYKTLAAAFVGDFVAIGRPRNVHGAIDARLGGSLGSDEIFKSAVDRLDVKNPLLYAYSPIEGVQRLLQRQPGLVGRVGDLLSRPGLRGVAAAARFQGAGIRVAISSEVVPALPGSAGAPPTFEPKIPNALPDDTIAYFGMKGLDRLFQRLTVIAGGERSTISRTVARLRRSLGRSGERKLRHALQPLFDREAALAVTPPADAPVVSLIVGDTTVKQGGDVLVALQPLLARLLQAPEEGQVPSLEPRQVAGVDTITLQLMPGLALTYAAFDGRIVVSTSTDGIRRLRQTGRALADNGGFAPRLGDFLREPTSVVFLDLHRLSALVERAGLGGTPEYRAIKPDVSKLGTVSVITTSERSSETTQVFVEVP